MATPRKSIVALAVGIVAACLSTSVHAANAYHAGDLLLGFQQVGSTDTLLFNLGDTALLFRDATTSFTITNIGALLVQKYGATWYDDPNVFFGAAGTWSNGDFTTDPTLQNKDPLSTLYVTKTRTAVGNESLKNSTLPNLNSNGAVITAANNMVALQQAYAQGTGSVFDSALANTWEDFNPLTGTTQNTAFQSYNAGIQFEFGAGASGTFSVGQVEGQLDLYRVDGADDATIPGAYHSSTNNRQGEFQGIITIDQSGNVKFVAVPEPSSVVMLMGGAGLLMMLRPRRAFGRLA